MQMLKQSWILRVQTVAFMLVALTAASRAASPPADVRRDAVVEAVEQVMPSVVNIGTKTRVERRGVMYDWFRDAYWPYTQNLPPQESAGSGVMIDEAGYVLTNVHVVEGADEVWVNADGQIYRADPIVGLRSTDVALLKIRAKPGDKFRAARFAADDDLLLGETVLALGNPFGLGGSVSRGILSSKTRRPDAQESSMLDVPDWLQTDASINPGNSGGPLINLRGEVIGMNVAVLRQAQGIGFAIPIKRVIEAISEIYTPETLKQLWFGARLRPGTHPVQVMEVEPESPADRAGLKRGDAILAIDGEPVRSFIDGTSTLMSSGESRTVKLQIQRGSERSQVSVRLVPESSFFNAELVEKKTGMKLRELTRELAESLGLARSGGLVIASVNRRGPAADARLEPGQVIRSIEGRAISEIRDLARLVHARKTGEKLRLAVVVEQKLGIFVRQGTVEVVLNLR